jgi:hypothetical protein
MKISETTSKTVSGIKEFSGNKIKNEQDTALLIEASSGNKQLFEDMVFTARYLNGLGKILHSNRLSSPGADKQKIDESAEEKIRNEFKQHMIKLNSQLSALLSDIPSEDKKAFEEKYLTMNRTSLVNLTNLIYDLSWVKKYINSKMKR